MKYFFQPIKIFFLVSIFRNMPHRFNRDRGYIGRHGGHRRPYYPRNYNRQSLWRGPNYGYNRVYPLPTYPVYRPIVYRPPYNPIDPYDLYDDPYDYFYRY
ncbi:putative orfan [Tupanvirus soda lake]|uniref:Orfan n=2 Tax=Tupanvirus TaxID=2094720 RepID=A0AC62AD99_9VIRU|nr:putative orfan [Tupanvirus soda lake]QKU35767.1 putative orfan [Tupanvirus soda lake]